MRVLKLQGTPRNVGQAYGESCREGFHSFHEMARHAASQRPHWYDELSDLQRAIEFHFPRFWDEMVGTAEGANLGMDQMLLNHRYALQAEVGCSNVAFLGSDCRPVFGSNLDLSPDPPWEWIVRVVDYENGQSITHCTWVGDIMGRDTCMNKHGLSVGGSSVGSVFQKSIRHPPIDDAIYSMICNCKSTKEAIEFLLAYPYFGKGYNFLLCDEHGEAVVLECACPLVQVRRPEPGQEAIYCTNIYRLPALVEADRRTPEGRLYSEKRNRYLEHKLFQERMPRTVDQMKALMSSQGPEGGLCRPIDTSDYSRTRMSVVTSPATLEFWYTDGQPSVSPYQLLK